MKHTKSEKGSFNKIITLEELNRLWISHSPNPKAEEIYRKGMALAFGIKILVHPDIATSFLWFKLAEGLLTPEEAEDFPPSIEEIQKGQDVIPEELLRKAISGDRDYRLILVTWYKSGVDIEVQSDYDEGMRLLTEAAELGHPDAQVQVGVHHLHTLSIQDAAKWFKLSAEQGCPDGEYLYGFLLVEGMVDEVDDRELGISQLKLAASKGHAEARKILEKMGVN